MGRAYSLGGRRATVLLELCLEHRLREKIEIIPQKVFIKSFGKSEFPHKFVELSFIIANVKNNMTDLCGN